MQCARSDSHVCQSASTAWLAEPTEVEHWNGRPYAEHVRRKVKETELEEFIGENWICVNIRKCMASSRFERTRNLLENRKSQLWNYVTTNKTLRSNAAGWRLPSRYAAMQSPAHIQSFTSCVPRNANDFSFFQMFTANWNQSQGLRVPFLAKHKLLLTPNARTIVCRNTAHRHSLSVWQRKWNIFSIAYFRTQRTSDTSIPVLHSLGFYYTCNVYIWRWC